MGILKELYELYGLEAVMAELARREDLESVAAPDGLSDAPRQLIVVDTTVPDWISLLDGLDPTAAVLVLDPARDGVTQITEALAGYQDLDAIHLLSHGSSGALSLGNASLSLNSLDQYADQLKQWSQALTAEADLLIYGCDVAAGDQGTLFVERLAGLTGADVAASTDVTGAAALGGDWVLEEQTGVIEAGALAVGESWVQVLGASTMDLSTLDGTTGFRLDGGAAYDWSGNSVSSAGDVNGDGFADLIVGASV